MTDFHNPKNPQCRLTNIELTRFAYTWANDRFTRREMGVMPSLSSMRNLVNIAIQFKRNREHGWNLNWPSRRDGTNSPFPIDSAGNSWRSDVPR